MGGHATMSCGFFSLMFLDGLFRVMPRIPMDIVEARQQAQVLEGRTTFLGFSPREWLFNLERWYAIVPITRADILDAFDFVTFTVVWALALLPVAPARVLLNDHDEWQVFVGGTVGAFEGMFWFVMLRHGIKKHYNHLLGHRVFYVFIHNHALPRFEVVGKCSALLAQYEDGGSANSSILQKL